MAVELGDLEWPSEMDLFVNGSRVGTGKIDDLVVLAGVVAKPGDRVSFQESRLGEC